MFEGSLPVRWCDGINWLVLIQSCNSHVKTQNMNTTNNLQFSFFWCRYWKLDLSSEPTLITGVFPITFTLLPQLHVIDRIYQRYRKLQRKRANYRKKWANCVCVGSSKLLDLYLSPIPLPWRPWINAVTTQLHPQHNKFNQDVWLAPVGVSLSLFLLESYTYH